MGSLLALYDNLADTGAINGPASLMPLSNMQDTRLERVWRSASDDPENTRFDITLPDIVTMRAIVLARTNATTAVKLRFVSYLDQSREVINYDSGIIEAGTRAPFGSIPWGSPNWWTGYQPPDDPDRPPDLIHILPGAGLARKYWSVEIIDQGNPEGFVEVSRLIMARGFAPSINYSYGSNGFSFEDNSPRQKTLNGAELIRRRVNPRVMQFAIDYLPEDEAFSTFYDFWRRSGFDREVYVIPDTDLVGIQLQRRSFLGTITQASSIAQNVFDQASVGCTIKERI